MKIKDFPNLMTGKIGIAVSGGSDSMCLLHYSLANNYAAEIVVINIEHGIRGDASKNDSRFVIDYCKEKGIECLHFAVDSLKFAKQNKISTEESARHLRYKIFTELLSQKKIDKIFTAHHSLDRAETLLLSLIRGGGTSGASAKFQGFEGVFRPLLNVSKQEINDYIEKNKVPYVVDASNFQNSYFRNLIRNKVFPFLNSINPRAEENLAKFCEKMQDLDLYLTGLAKKFVKVEKYCTKISIKIPNELMFYAAKLCKAEVESINVEQLIKLKFAENNKQICLKGSFASKEYEYITIYKTEPEYKIIWHKCSELPQMKQKITNILRPLFADKSKIPHGAIIRKLEPGDIFIKFDGTKKAANDFLQERKISARLKKNLPVLAVDNEILLIFGVEISKKLAVTGIENCYKVQIKQMR